MRLSKISRNTGIIFSLFVTVFLAYSSQILSQNKEHLIALKNCSVRARFVDSLFHCHQYTDNEGEFTFWVYSFPDGEDVIFCQGNFVEFMEDDLVPKEVMTDGIKSTSWGLYDDGKVWRIDRYGHNITIYYCRVPQAEKNKYDIILNSVVIQKVK